MIRELLDNGDGSSLESGYCWRLIPCAAICCRSSFAPDAF